MTIAIVGSRTFDDYSTLNEIILKTLNIEDIDCVISGGARGADSLAEKFASEHSLAFVEFPAKWERYGKSAGYRRNVTIVQNADMIFAFWNGTSKGTKHTIDIAKVHDTECVIYYYEE